MPISMLGLGIILMVSQWYAVEVDGKMAPSYGVAGRVAAAFIVVQAACSPQIARLVDRHGQARIMRPAIALHVLGLATLVTAAYNQAPEWLLYCAAIPAGATLGSIGAMVRARWALVLTDPRDIHTAHSLESVFDEVVFIVGPVLTTVLSTTVFPAAGLITSAVACVGGGLLLLAQRGTEPPPQPQAETKSGSVMRSPGMLVVVVVFVLVGGIFGSTDVATVAFTEEHGAEGTAGLVLAFFATGSLVSGLLYGARQWIKPVGQRFVWGVIALALGVVPFFFITSIPVLAAVMLVSGFAIAPTLIAGNALVQEFVAPGRLTEGLTWVGTALGVGVSAGSSVAGSLIDKFDSHAGFACAIAAGTIGVFLALVTRRWLVSAPPRATEP